MVPATNTEQIMGSKKTAMMKNTKLKPLTQASASGTSEGGTALNDGITRSKPANRDAERIKSAPVVTGSGRAASKLSRLEALLRRPKGATVAQLGEALGWQKHSVRGAMSGTLKKRGFAIVSEKTKGERYYRIAS